MIFSLKYLVLPLRIMACIHSYNINAMNTEIKYNNIHTIITSVPWVNFEQLVLSFSEDNLDNNKIKFIQRIANAASSIQTDKSTWHNLSHKRLL